MSLIDGLYGGTNVDIATSIINHAYDLGINFFDTAEMYSVPVRPETRGLTNRIIGQWFKKRKNRDKIILADKVAGRGSFSWFRPNGENTKLNKKQIVLFITMILIVIKIIEIMWFPTIKLIR